MSESENHQGPKESDAERLQRLPHILRDYADTVSRIHKFQIDSDQAGVMHRSADFIERLQERLRKSVDMTEGPPPGPPMSPAEMQFFRAFSEVDRLLSRNEHLGKALHGFVEEFDEWDDNEEPEISEAAKARNKRVRVYRRGKNALSAEPEEEDT